MINPKNLLLLMLGMLTAAPLFGQRFTKREQARREARAANYFCGASFTFTGGYEHSWCLSRPIHTTTDYYGKREYLQDTHEAFNIGFLYDHALSRKWGIQLGLYYNQKGCDKDYYYDSGLGYGYNRYDSESLMVQGIELQGQVRRFFPINYYSRLSINAGLFVDKLVDSPAEFENWDLGAQVGIGYDWKHLSVSVNYQPGVFPLVAKDCYTRMCSLSLNVGYRLWKK